MARYALNPRDSRFTVKVTASGMLASFGHNPTLAVRKCTGQLEFDPAAPTEASFEITIRADSLEVIDDMKADDRREIERATRDDVLEASRYGEIKFTSSEVAAEKLADNLFQLRISGNLALHGVTKQQSVAAQAKLRDDEVRLRGELKLSQAAFKIKKVTALAGALKVKDELELSFDLVGETP